MSSSEWDSDVDSDTELQRAFAEGRLKPGLHKLKPEAPARKNINNVAGLQQKLKDIQQDLDWEERLDVTLDGADRIHEDEVDDDFKLEMKFYHQAQAAVLCAIPKLKELGIQTKRPPDFFAEMAKPDHHMKKIREKLMEKKVGMERSEQAKKLREAKKYGKKVQQEVALKRQQEKKELGEAVKKFRKGKANNLDDILEGTNKKTQPNKKRQQKNRKFGFGGQKKRSKRNTKQSLDNPWKMSAKPGSSKPGQGKSKHKPNRPGKARRNQNKNRGKK
ncbi:putative rRNA-processing protein EBP2 [Babylonia areolata]|uniref:putative rRNA-processing protein EBP2 n=1 Tax=Babylonia areolata TaxID=304850 RepID=UPI003FD1BFA2